MCIPAKSASQIFGYFNTSVRIYCSSIKLNLSNVLHQTSNNLLNISDVIKVPETVALCFNYASKQPNILE